MNLFNRNNKKTISLQQQADVNHKPLVPVVISYPHRVDANGNIPTKVVFVKSTVQPPHNYASFLAWSLRIRIELLFMNGGLIIFNPFRGGYDAH